MSGHKTLLTGSICDRKEYARKLICFGETPTPRKVQLLSQNGPQFMGVIVCGVDYNGL